MVAPLIRIAQAIPSFIPPDGSNLVGWWDASAIVGLASNDACGTFADKSGNGLDLLQAGAASLKPTYKTNQVNNLPALSFDGGDYMTAVSTALTGADIPASLIYVAKSTNVPAGNVYAFGAYNSAATNGIFPTGYAASSVLRGGRRDDAGSAVIASSTGTVTTTNANVHSYIFSGTKQWIYGNGAEKLAETACDAGTITLDRIIIGALNASLGNPFTGTFCEGLIYKKKLDESERKKIESYLATKWGISLA